MRRSAKPSKYVSGRQRLFVFAIAGLVVAFVLSLVPTPFYLIAPGSAVDLSTRVSVEGRPPPQRHLYLTDVTVARASVLLLAARLWPGVRLVRRDAIVPPGVSARGYDRVLTDAMGESQTAAAVVAERAAGYRVVEPPRRVVVAEAVAGSGADGVLFAGDVVQTVRGRPVRTLADLARAMRGVAPGTAVEIVVVRAGRTSDARVVATAGPRGVVRLGVLARERTDAPDLPVPVRYDVGDIAGSSGGLMFALEIYTSLRPGGGGGAIAGTGTIASDGRVGPIEGARQKAIAAERAGVKTFLVPRADYAEAARETGIRVVPVDTFRDALAGLAARGGS